MPAGYSYLYKGTKESEAHGMGYVNTITDIIQWGRNKGLNDPKAQLNKVIEEVGEIAHEITRNHYDLNAIDQPDELVDALGDSFVTLLILSDILGVDPLDAMFTALEAIKNRKGKTVNGTFVKAE